MMMAKLYQKPKLASYRDGKNTCYIGLKVNPELKKGLEQAAAADRRKTLSRYCKEMLRQGLMEAGYCLHEPKKVKSNGFDGD